MNTTPHTVAPEEVMALLDGELAPDEAIALSQHSEDCPECGYLAERFRQTSRRVASWKVGTLPAEAEDAILIAIAATNARNPSWMRRHWVISSAGAMAAALLIVFSIQSRRSTDQYKMHAYMRPQAEAVDGNVPLSSTRMNAEAVMRVPKPSSNVDGLTGGQVEQKDKQLNSLPAPHTAPAPMIARTVTLTMQVKDFAKSRAVMDAIVGRYQGYAATLTANTPEGTAQSLDASLRIPAPQLSAALADLKRLGRVQNETQSGDEVTQQHADLIARLKNSRETEERLQAILQQRTGKIEDILQVEEEIARVRGEIEGMEADRQALNHRVDFASVELLLNEEYKEPLIAPDGFAMNRVHNALVSGWRNAAGFLLGVVLITAESGPTLLELLLLFGLPAFLLWRRYRKLRQSL